MRIKIKIFFLFTLLANSFLVAQHDHLEPLRSNIDDYDFMIEYNNWIKKILFKKLEDFEIRYLVIPSFSPEYVLQIQQNEHPNSYSIVNHKALKSIWYSKKKSRVKIQRVINDISKEDVDLIKELFELAIYETKYSKSNIVGMDGTTYTFSVSNLDIKSGETWSPKKGTKMFKLKEIAEKLIIESSNSNFTRISNELKKEIRLLIDEFIQSDKVSSQLSLKNKVQLAIVEHLNKNINSFNLKTTRGNFNFEYYFNKDGTIERVINLEELNLLVKEKNKHREFKIALLTLNLSGLNFKNDFSLKINLSYDKKNGKLVIN